MKSSLFLALIVCLSIGLVCSMTNPKVRREVRKTTDPIFLNETYWSGFLPIEDKGSLFFWLFESRADAAHDPLIIWLTGGPGCSSEIALFSENGPFKVNHDNETLSINPYSWNNVANILYVDQPLGTGYSTAVELDQNETAIAGHFYIFLQEFLEEFPQFQGRDFYITGESYGGHYIPAISANILRTGGLNLNFKGVGIGNGLVSVYHQYPQYATFAYENQLVDEDLYHKLVTGFSLCDSLIDLNQTQAAMIQCQLQVQRITGKPLKFNVYDIREPCTYPPLCYDLSGIDAFLMQRKVQQVLNVTGRPWAECNTTVHIFLSQDFMTDLTDDLSYMTESGLQILIYHGDKDFICNWRGGENLSLKLSWSGAGQFNQANYTPYNSFGEYRQYKNLIFYRVFNAGHMVPMDQPAAAVDMLSRMIKGW